MRRGSNSTIIPPAGLNSGSFKQLGFGTDAIGSRAAGQLGQLLYYDRDGAKVVSHAPTGILLEGGYQLVKFGVMTAPARGQLVFWDTFANNGARDYKVTNVSTATADFKAGVLITALSIDGGPTLAGEFGWIQVAGLASGLYGTVTSAVIGNLVTQTSLTTNTFDAHADAGTTFATNGGAKLFAGIAYELPASASIRQIWMNPMGFYPRIAK